MYTNLDFMKRQKTDICTSKQIGQWRCSTPSIQVCVSALQHSGKDKTQINANTCFSLISSRSTCSKRKCTITHGIYCSEGIGDCLVWYREWDKIIWVKKKVEIKTKLEKRESTKDTCLGLNADSSISQHNLKGSLQ